MTRAPARVLLANSNWQGGYERPKNSRGTPHSVRTSELLRSGLPFRGRADQVLLEIVPWIMM